MWRMMCAVLVVAGCNDAMAGPKPITPRAQLPDALRPLVPQHGVLAVGGGLTSGAWRIVIDYDAATVFSGASHKAGAPSYGALDASKTAALSAADRKRLGGLAAAAWVEPPPATMSPPIADYDEILIIADGDDTFELEGFGPIRRPAAAKVLTALHAIAPAP